MTVSKSGMNLVFAIVLIAGFAFDALSVKNDTSLYDIDEAAWIFNGYYYDLYFKGDWKSQYWTAFDKYAQHPPATAYLFGGFLHAIGEPMKSIGPRRFWFENDLTMVTAPQKFIWDLHSRFTPRQLVACRYMSAYFAWLAAAALMIIAYNLVGPLGAAAGFVLMTLQPVFRNVASMALGDSFIIFVSSLAVVGAIFISRKSSREAKALIWPAVLCALPLGIAFASKINCYALALPVIVLPLILADNRKRALVAAIAAVALAFAIAYALDPGLHGAFIERTLERFNWRLDRIEIQRLVFADQAMRTPADRISFASYFLFFRDYAALAFFVLSVAGIAFAFLGSERKRETFAIFFLAAFAAASTVATLPLAWTRYLVGYLPFLMLPACLGFEKVFNMLSNPWASRLKRADVVVSLAIIVVVSLFMMAFLSPPERHFPRKATELEREVGRMYAISLMKSGSYDDIHRKLMVYFESVGDTKRASREREELLKIEKERQK